MFRITLQKLVGCSIVTAEKGTFKNQIDMFRITLQKLVGFLLVVLFYGVSALFGSFNVELDFKQFSLVQV